MELLLTGCYIDSMMEAQSSSLDPDQSEGAVARMTTSKETSDVQVSHVQPDYSATKQAREMKLSQMLDIGEDQLTPEEVVQVYNCVLLDLQLLVHIVHPGVETLASCM